MRLIRFIAPVLTVAALAAFAAPPARAQEDQPAGLRARGQGVVSARPDVAILEIGANVRRDTAGAAFERASAAVAALTDSLRANGVEERDVQTRQFNLSPEYSRGADDSTPRVVGWRATQTVSVKLRDFSRLGRVIDDAVAALGVEATLGGISFAIEDTNALATRARADAVANARAKAEEMAALAGVRVGRLISLQEITSPAPTPVQNDLARGGATPSFAAAPLTQISAGELNVTVIVDAIFAIE